MEAPAPIVDWNRFFEDVKYTLPSEQAVVEDIHGPLSTTYQNSWSTLGVDEDLFAICEDIAARNSLLSDPIV